MKIGPQESNPTPQPRKSWTVLVYSASNNDLYDHQIEDMDEMEKVGSNPRLHLVGQIYQREAGQETGSVKRVELHPDSAAGLHSPVRSELGDVSMSDPQALADFVEWGIKNYPADNYWLIISDHGDGWKGACQDDAHDGWISTPQLEQALQTARERTGRKLDLLSFDACYMGSLEVAQQLHQEASYMVGCQEEVGWFGLPYQKALQDLAQTPREQALKLVQLASENQQEFMASSALDLSQIPKVTSAFARLTQEVSSLPTESIKAAIDKSQSYWEYKDPHDLAAQLAEAHPELAPAARDLHQAIDAAVIAKQHDSAHPNSHGLQIGVSEDKDYGVKYADTEFARLTGWNRVVERLGQP